ncbi:MAG: response regulator [Alphaproteobacteria bacterium]|nr:response regulator [Alphaproteobacteria bacterium]
MKLCLVVDDSRVVRTVARKILEDLSFTVSEAEDGKTALSLCQSQKFDAVLLDWNMPVMNGLEFIKSLRASGINPQPKVIFCTTENSKNQIVEAIGAGADEYIMKPFDSEIIESKFRQVGLI